MVPGTTWFRERHTCENLSNKNTLVLQLQKITLRQFSHTIHSASLSYIRYIRYIKVNVKEFRNPICLEADVKFNQTEHKIHLFFGVHPKKDSGAHVPILTAF